MIKFFMDWLEYRRLMKVYAEELEVWNRKAKLYNIWGIRF